MGTASATRMGVCFFLFSADIAIAIPEIHHLRQKHDTLKRIMVENSDAAESDFSYSRRGVFFTSD